MSAYIRTLKENAGVTIFVTNLALTILVFFIYDPFGLTVRDYNSSAPLLAADQTRVSKIEIIDPNISGKKIILTKGSKLPEPEAGSKTKPSDPGKTKFAGPRFAWKLDIQDQKDVALSESYGADQDRVDDFFERLSELKRYYSVKRSPEKDKTLEMYVNKNGDYYSLSVKFHMGDGKTHTLYTGRSKGGESYVRLDQENDIWLVRSNIKSRVGAGELFYFRNRRFLPGNVSSDDIVSVEAKFKGSTPDLRLSKSGPTWSLEKPLQARANLSAVSSLLGDITGWKASAFPEKTPEGLDKKRAFDLTLNFNSQTGPAQIQLEVLGEKNSTFYVKRKDKSEYIYEVYSAYLGDLFDAEKKLTEKSQAPALSPLAPRN